MEIIQQLLWYLTPEGITYLIQTFGMVGICLIIFAETGIFALLPGDSLLVLALGVPEQDAVSADERKRIAAHLLRHQEADGSWAWSSAPAKNRPPPVFESDEVATLLGYMALGPHVPADPSEKSDIRDAREKAAAWLAKTEPSDTTALLRNARPIRAVRDEENSTSR